VSSGEVSWAAVSTSRTICSSSSIARSVLPTCLDISAAPSRDRRVSGWVAPRRRDLLAVTAAHIVDAPRMSPISARAFTTASAAAIVSRCVTPSTRTRSSRLDSMSVRLAAWRPSRNMQIARFPSAIKVSGWLGPSLDRATSHTSRNASSASRTRPARQCSAAIEFRAESRSASVGPECPGDVSGGRSRDTGGPTTPVSCSAHVIGTPSR